MKLIYSMLWYRYQRTGIDELKVCDSWTAITLGITVAATGDAT